MKRMAFAVFKIPLRGSNSNERIRNCVCGECCCGYGLSRAVQDLLKYEQHEDFYCT